MKKHRKIISIGCSLVGLSAALAPAAQASPLLSGYGGPGQGSQAILGSALLNGPRSGGGVGTGGGSRGANGPSTVAVGRVTSSGSGVTTDDATRPPAGGRHRAPRNGEREGEREKAALASSFYPASEELPAGQHSTALGLSSEDVVLMILAACAVVLTGVLVRRLTRPSRPDGIGG
jgi:hypothetical protein